MKSFFNNNNTRITMMMTIISLVIVLSLPLTQQRVLDHDSVIINDLEFIKKTCKQTPDPELCESTLTADPKSADANLINLALIAVSAVDAKANATLKRVEERLKIAKAPKEVAALSTCAEEYNAIITADIPVAIEGITKGGYKFAESSMNDAVVEARSCERKLVAAGKSPITDLTRNVGDVAALASSLTRMLL